MASPGVGGGARRHVRELHVRPPVGTSLERDLRRHRRDYRGAVRDRMASGPSPRRRDRMTSIALVDDHRVVSRSLKAYLESFPDLTVVGIAVSGEELLAHLGEWKPDVVLQDLL